MRFLKSFDPWLIAYVIVLFTILMVVAQTELRTP